MYDFDPILSRLKSIKKASGLTNQELADKAGVPAGTVNKILSGDTVEPKLPGFMAIASALGTSVDFLVYGKEQSSPVLSPAEQQLVNDFRSLNEEGQEKVSEYAADLVASGRYQKKNRSLSMADPA